MNEIEFRDILKHEYILDLSRQFGYTDNLTFDHRELMTAQNAPTRKL